MSSLNKSIESKFNELRQAIKTDRGKAITSQGVNAFLLVYPPEEEDTYLERAKKDFASEYIIDLSELFVELIDEWGFDNFKEAYKNYRSTLSAIFSNESSENPDLMNLIRREVKKARDNEQKPVLIRTGILYGTDIRNKVILEDDIIKELTTKRPLIIFYPGKVEKDMNEKERVWFLGVQKASDYRGQLI